MTHTTTTTTTTNNNHTTDYDYHRQSIPHDGKTGWICGSFP